MKILQIINSLGTGGAEKLLLDTIPLYRKAGIEMDVLLLWDNNNPFVVALKNLDICKVIVLNKSKNFKDIYSLSGILKLRAYLKNYEIAHVHLFPAQYYVVLANLLNGNTCKLIFTEHNTTNRRIQKNYLKFIEFFFYSRYKKIVFISNEILNIYTGYLPQYSNRFIMINNGVNLEMIENAEIIDITTIHPFIKVTNKLIVQVSAFRIQKDQKTLINAMVSLPENFLLLLVGDGETKKECEELVESNSLQKRVLFLGQRMDVAQLLKIVDLVVLSSKYEGLSLSSIEGMASGKPFLGSNVPGIKDVVGGAGVLFDQGNTEDLVNKIMELMNNPKLYNQVVNSCQNRAKQYDIQVMIEKHIKLYHEVYKN